MGKFGMDEDEEDVLAPKEPQVNSQDPMERKAARALRIKRRKEALKRADQPLEEVSAEEAPGLIDQATAVAAEELQQLTLDGAAQVTNVKVTTDEREVTRRALFSQNMKNSLHKIEEEANEAQVQYEAITFNWESMLKIKDPLDIDAAMKEQKEKCDALIEQKNLLIKDVQLELKRTDQAYYDDLEKQDRDIKELSERIEKQITIMQRSYEKQLFLIEHAINMEREAMVDHNSKRWEALYKQRDREELSHMEYQFQQLDENKQEMEKIMWDHHEKFREAKIELEILIQELQKELEKLKAICIINSEKIGYNYQVLRKREEENVFVRSQQKRKLNKMSDVANSLRAKIRKAAEDGAAEEIRADAEISNLIIAMGNLEKKCDHFSHVNDYKFNQVWRMSASKCSEMVQELRQAEIALHAHVLAEPPPPPPPAAPRSPIKAYRVIEGAVEKSEIVEKKQSLNEDDKAIVEYAKDKLVRHIMQLVSDNTGFLVEDRLLKLIEKYQQSSRNLCTLDAIFMALEIQGEEDIELLCTSFLRYAFCPTCANMEMFSDENIHRGSHESTERKQSIRARASIGRASIAGRSMSASTSRSAHVAFRGQDLSPSDQMLMIEADEIIKKYGEIQVRTVAPVGGSDGSVRGVGGRGVTVTSQLTIAGRTIHPYLCPAGHVLEIEPTQVLQALGEFVSVFVPPEKQRLNDILDGVQLHDCTTPSRRVKLEEIEQYWLEWKKIFPPEKDKFWDGLHTGLNNYLNILQERERLHEIVEQLRKKNTSLRRLLRGALPELAPVLPHYARPVPTKFITPAPEKAAGPSARLPRI